MTIVRACVVQAASIGFDRDRTLEWVLALATEAASSWPAINRPATMSNTAPRWPPGRPSWSLTNPRPARPVDHTGMVSELKT